MCNDIKVGTIVYVWNPHSGEYGQSSINKIQSANHGSVATLAPPYNDEPGVFDLATLEKTGKIETRGKVLYLNKADIVDPMWEYICKQRRR